MGRLGNGSTSVRAAYGVFNSRVANLSYATSGGANTNAPAFGSPSINVLQPGTQFSYQLGSSGGYYFPPPPGFSFQIGPAGNIVGTRVSVGGMDTDPKQPTTQDYTPRVSSLWTNTASTAGTTCGIETVSG